ncbi:MAG: hypothetical protein Q6354_05900 [Candidatus Brocadiales bacterium]|nr:hypothetical protein [Candidatus Brocadiales bacterium]
MQGLHVLALRVKSTKALLLPAFFFLLSLCLCPSSFGHSSCGKAVTTHPAFQFHPQIWGSRILWLDRRMGRANIFMYDPSKDEEMPLLETEQEISSIRLHRDKVVYQAWSRNWDVWLLDLESGDNRPVSKGDWHELLPRVWGDLVVWEDWRNGYGLGDIYLYNLKNEEALQITNDPATQGRPDIYKDKVVWHDNRHGNWDIYLYDLTKKEEERITYDSSDQFSPVIHGERILWVDTRNGNWDIYMYDISTKTTLCLCNEPSKQWWPQVWKDTALWVDERGGKSTIYIYDISTGTQKPLCDSPAPQRQPCIYQDRVVWMDFRNGDSEDVQQGNWDIFTTFLPLYRITTNRP